MLQHLWVWLLHNRFHQITSAAKQQVATSTADIQSPEMEAEQEINKSIHATADSAVFAPVL